MANWYVKRGSKTAGPLTQQRLKELATQGKLIGTDLVRKGEEGSFFPADQIPGLIPDLDTEKRDTDVVKTQPSSTTSAKKNKTPLIAVLAVLGFGAVIASLFLLSTDVIKPSIDKAQQSAHRITSQNNLKQIGLALSNYEGAFRVFPPGRIETADGTPYHSWQALILPQIDYSNAYQRIDFDLPWTAPDNMAKLRQEIPTYLHPSIETKTSPQGLGLTHYVGNKLVLPNNTPLRYRNITDGVSLTIMAVESGENFKPWGDPTNTAEPVNILGAGKKSPLTDGSEVLMMDGSVRFISNKIDPALLKALSTPAAGDSASGF